MMIHMHSFKHNFCQSLRATRGGAPSLPFPSAQHTQQPEGTGQSQQVGRVFRTRRRGIWGEGEELETLPRVGIHRYNSANRST